MYVDCPFCTEEDRGARGCCFCEFKKKIRIAPGEFWESIEDLNSYQEAMTRNAIEAIQKMRRDITNSGQ